jgi:ribonuclease HI
VLCLGEGEMLDFGEVKNLKVGRYWMLYIYTDGASRGNPGESASGYRFLDSSRRLLRQHVLYNGVCTNNVAEYSAIIAALKDAIKMGNKEIILHSDSKLVVNQLCGSYKIKDAKMKKLNDEAVALLAGFDKWELLCVPRENREVGAVDKALNVFLDGRGKEKHKYGRGQLQTKL